MFLKIFLLSLAIFLNAVYGQQFSFQTVKKNLILFGSGYEDNGVNAPDDVVGLHQYSTGKVWPQILADQMGAKLQNYAIAGSKSDVDTIFFTGWGGNNWQVGEYLKLNPRVPQNTLIGVASGAINEIDLPPYPKVDNVSIDTMVSNLMKGIQKLADAGASAIFICNLPDKTTVPGLAEGSKIVTTFTADMRKALQQIVLNHNEKLNTAIAAMATRNPYTKFIPVDFYKYWADGVKSMTYQTTVGFECGTDGLAVPGDVYAKGTSKPDDMTKYAFYDYWHPASGVHLSIATNIQAQLRSAGVKIANKY